MKILGIIGARSGSKGVPGKNIRPLLGKPLIGWIIEKAKKSKYINRVIVSTDSEQYAEIARSFGAETPFLRPKEFAADTMAAKETKEIRLIRDKAGFYYLTGKKFKNVYVLAQSDGALGVSNTLTISAEKMMDDPKFDQKDSYIELWNGKDKFQLTKGGAQPVGGRK